MIKIQDLSIEYGTFKAVDGLSFSVNQGELFGFLGPNGAGKTTTIKCLTGSIKPTHGNVEIVGYSLPKHFQKVKPLIAYVPDTENHYDDFSGRENLCLYADLYGVSYDNVDLWLSRLQLIEASNLKVRNYSKGMKKKLLIARALIHQPKVIFFDEPTANLDIHSVKLVRGLLREIANAGTSVFLTTHDMDEVEQICDRVAIIAKGKLLDIDTPTAFITRHAERYCDVQYDHQGQLIRKTLHLDITEDKQRLSEIVLNEKCVRIHSREFRFEDVFRKLTGEAYQ
jgi:ABC-2 type transport system ATP-binding protein